MFKYNKQAMIIIKAGGVKGTKNKFEAAVQQDWHKL